MEIKGRKLVLKKGDITEEEVDAIVNAANPYLRGGGGVDGAIHRKGGPSIMEECREIMRRRGGRPLERGEAVITGGGKLKAKYVIHTAGPVWMGGDKGEPEALRRAYTESLKLASSRGLKTVSFPSISTGAYGYPVREAARVAIKAIIDFLKGEEAPEEVRLVLYDDETYRVYEEVLKEYGEGNP